MLDLKNLSKQKYIYRVYVSQDKHLHCQQYPIVYINSKVVYFKTCRKDEYLGNVLVGRVRNDFVTFCEDNDPTLIDQYFWKVDPYDLKMFDELKKRYQLAKEERERLNHIKRLDQAKIDYFKALEEVEKLGVTPETVLVEYKKVKENF